MNPMPFTALPFALLPALLLALTALMPAHAQTPAPTAPAVPVVSVSPLAAAAVRPVREAPASVLPRNESRLAAESAGTVQRWTVDVGQTVARGALLVQLDARDAQIAQRRAQAALDAAQADLQLAEAQLARARQLVAQQFLSQEALTQRETERVRAQTSVNRERAEVAASARELARTTLRAPFAGTVKERLVQVGETVAPGTVLYVLVEDGFDQVQATLTPADAPSLRTGTDLRLETPQGTHALRLLRVGSAVTAPARTLSARLAFADAGTAPPPGSSGTLRWTDAQPHLPPALLVRRGNALGVFVLQGDTARFVALPGAQEGRAVPVPATLAADARVVTRGQAQLQDGVRVEIAR